MGGLLSTLNFLIESFPPKPIWSVEDMPDLGGKVIIVTGGNAGIGKETVKNFLRRGAKVYIASRSEERVCTAIHDLKAETGKEALFLKLDLSDLKSVKAAAEEFLSKETKLDILFDNGGILCPSFDTFTAQGYDMQFGTNVLGHFYLNKLLLPLLISTAEAAKQRGEDPDVRIVNTSSYAHMFLKTLEFDTFKDSPKRRKADPMDLYGQSKFGGIVMAKELARRYGDKGIISNSFHPGNIKTDIINNIPYLQRIFLEMILYDVSYGVLTGLYAAVSPEGKAHNGAYFVPFARLGKALPETDNPKLGADLWTWMEEQVTAFEASL
ncbi:NAD-P-binding protein [Dentipellis sp. KUC8613]|nr:NAD-P-binding protein [Dentipellis sp. KUC8613]